MKQLSTEYKRYDSHIITTVSPTTTGQTGIPNRSDRSGLCATRDQKSGVSGRILGVSGLPSPENPDLNPECPDYHKPGVSEHMAGLSGPLPVRPVQPRPKAGILGAAKIAHKPLNPSRH